MNIFSPNTLHSTLAMWYTSRATGVVSLVLMSLVVIIGLMVNRQGRLPGMPGFAVLGLHRYLSLLSITFLAVHIATAVLDTFVNISVAAAVVPFVSAYEPLWLGLGTVAFDLMIAIIITSLLRAHLGRLAWKAVHWLAYAAWPVAVVHSVYSSKDMQRGALLGLALACIAAVLVAMVWRFARALAETPRARRVPELMADPDQLARAGRR
ncbi:MAG TPA: ferric reductase-like transmembrane domain-containing protein [Streptosporangiaceae bacterium]|jgi:predicted ferric reductase